MGRIKIKEEITLDTIVQRDPDQEFSMIDDEVVMLSMKNGKYYALNNSASKIWELIEKPMKVLEIVEIILKEYAVDYETCIFDTIECLNEFRNNSLIKGKLI